MFVISIIILNCRTSSWSNINWTLLLMKITKENWNISSISSSIKPSISWNSFVSCFNHFFRWFFSLEPSIRSKNIYSLLLSWIFQIGEKHEEGKEDLKMSQLVSLFIKFKRNEKFRKGVLTIHLCLQTLRILSCCAVLNIPILHIALSSQAITSYVVGMLLAHGANIDEVSNRNTPLHTCLKNRESRQVLYL